MALGTGTMVLRTCGASSSLPLQDSRNPTRLTRQRQSEIDLPTLAVSTHAFLVVRKVLGAIATSRYCVYDVPPLVQFA